jgi:RNA polymerase sigma-70 factor (ECF subfamily)
VKSVTKFESANEDERLIREAQKGNDGALGLLFARHTGTLYQTALRLLGNAEDAEDALQDGLLSAFRNLRRFEGRSQFSTWLTRIVINAALMRMRSQRARPTVPLDQEDPEQKDLTLAGRIPDQRPNPEQIYVGKEQFEIFASRLEALPPALRSAVWLRDVEGLSTEEAARALGLSQGTLKSQLHRARLKLSELVRSRRRAMQQTATA